MNGRWKVVVVVALVSGLSGCAYLRSEEAEQIDPMLAAAGFQMRPADSAEKLEQLKTLPPLKVVPHQEGDKTYFLVADPYACNCLYVGTAANYERYERISLRQEAAQDRLEAAEMNEDAAMQWGMWGPWGYW